MSVDPHQVRPPTVAESVAQVVATFLCEVFGHTTDECVPFCLRCLRDVPGVTGL